MPPTPSEAGNPWPAIPYEDWKPTCITLHRWIQIVGKIRLVQTPWINHSWHATLYVSGRGLTTSPIPYGSGWLEIEFDFIDHALRIQTSDRAEKRLDLSPRPVAEFYAMVMRALEDLNTPVRIYEMPSEVPEPIRFSEDVVNHEYDADAAARFWRALVQIDRVFKAFRTGFIGKSSPVHLFWGALDLATTRFSGRTAPPHPAGVPGLPDDVAREAYSHEVSSAGFWPGGGGVDEPTFYSYAYPEPPGFAEAKVKPAEAFYHDTLREFVLPYDAVRNAPDPDAHLLAFLNTTYEAAASLANWDRPALECELGRPGVVRQI